MLICGSKSLAWDEGVLQCGVLQCHRRTGSKSEESFSQSRGEHPIVVGCLELHFGAMQRSLTYPPLTSGLEAQPELNVVIAYEDFETGKRAKTTYDFLSENLGTNCKFSSQMWKFEVLGIPKLREMAAQDAAV